MKKLGFVVIGLVILGLMMGTVNAGSKTVVDFDVIEASFFDFRVTSDHATNIFAGSSSPGGIINFAGAHFACEYSDHPSYLWAQTNNVENLGYVNSGSLVSVTSGSGFEWWQMDATSTAQLATPGAGELVQNADWSYYHNNLFASIVGSGGVGNYSLVDNGGIWGNQLALTSSGEFGIGTDSYVRSAHGALGYGQTLGAIGAQGSGEFLWLANGSNYLEFGSMQLAGGGSTALQANFNNGITGDGWFLGR
ncbi:MAG: hypothetical protein ACOYCE_03125 [Limnochordia bacterium]|jgi:hypothetical protein